MSIIYAHINNAAPAEYKALDDALASMFSFFGKVSRVGERDLPFLSLREQISRVLEAIRMCISALGRVDAERKGTGKTDDIRSGGSSEGFSSERHYCFELRSALEEVSTLCESTRAQAANNPAFLLRGLAGTGKTHLFCDVAQRRVRNGLPTFIFLGEEFTDRNPWAVMTGLLGRSTDPTTFLEILNEYGRRRRTRVLMMIDALNEAPIKVDWSALLQARPYRYIAIAVSIRTGFERQILRQSCLDQFVRDEHRGFEFREWEAVTKFFAAFRVPLPEVPLLRPEFQNPLFLMLFCRGLNRRQRRSDREAFRGHEGSTYIFEQFVKNGADRIAREFHLPAGRDKAGKYVIWDTVIEPIAEHMATQRRGADRISERTVLAIIGAAHPPVGARQLLRSLERHFLLARVPRYSKQFRESGYEYRFPFQKFSDNLIVRYLLKHHLGDPVRSFRASSKLGKILHRGWNRGLIEALAVQVPERLNGTDLVTVAPVAFRSSDVAIETFLESIVWRAPRAFHVEGALRYINETVIRTRHGHQELFEAFLTVATIPDHPFNANLLHSYLEKWTMARRDAWWLPFLRSQYGESRAVDRLVSWAWEGGDKTHIGDAPLELAGTVLAWFFAASNRFLRDRAAKALVALLTNRTAVVEQLLRRFTDVNDPYVAERLYATAYGCALRADARQPVGRLAQLVYDQVFAAGNPPAHILLRDYARGVIETALHRGDRLTVTKPFRPPYGSRWPGRIPSEKRLKAKHYERHRQCRYMWHSVLGSGDFDRYVIQPKCGHFSSRRLGAPRIPSRKELYDDFVMALTPGQKRSWRRLHPVVTPSFVRRLFRHDSEPEPTQEQLTAYERQLHANTVLFSKSLTTKQRRTYREVVIPYENSPGSDEFRFDIAAASRWIYERIFTLGWTPELFGDFDDGLSRGADGRDARKAERVGKKYQWIALHEVLARAADNFEFRDEVWSSAQATYSGPWQLSARDLDPSSVLRQTADRSPASGRAWWMPVKYDAWARRTDDVTWIKSESDLPRVPRFIQVKDPRGTEYLLLNGFARWEQPTPPGQERYEQERRDVWFMVKSYLVRRHDAERLYKWAAAQDFTGRWMPESHEFYTVFLREFPWAPAFQSIYTPYYSHNEWTRIDMRSREKLPVRVLITDDEYLKESSSFDCSVDDAIHVKLPAKWIYDRMGLKLSAQDGTFTDESGHVTVLDPSVSEDGPAALLVDKRKLVEFLRKYDCNIIWTVVGEKGLIGGRIGGGGYWPGRLEISGSFRLDRHYRLTGSVGSKATGPEQSITA